MIKKALSKMTLEELWELFPIFLVPHNEQWVAYYNEMKNFYIITSLAIKFKESVILEVQQSKIYGQKIL